MLTSLRQSVRKKKPLFETRFFLGMVQRPSTKMSRDMVSCLEGLVGWEILDTSRLDRVNWVKINLHLNKLVIKTGKDYNWHRGLKLEDNNPLSNEVIKGVGRSYND